jgi:hypothetical protein
LDAFFIREFQIVQLCSLPAAMHRINTVCFRLFEAMEFAKSLQGFHNGLTLLSNASGREARIARPVNMKWIVVLSGSGASRDTFRKEVG